MTAKKGWEKSTNGPDWTDVEMAIRAVDGVHLGQTTVTISPLGIGSSGGMTLEIVTRWPNVPGAEGISEVSSRSSWPCPDCTTLAGHILGGLYRHDFNIGEAYVQARLEK
jgi:hypothetical protein